LANHPDLADARGVTEGEGGDIAHPEHTDRDRKL
jgi:hypothetical protein